MAVTMMKKLYENDENYGNDDNGSGDGSAGNPWWLVQPVKTCGWISRCVVFVFVFPLFSCMSAAMCRCEIWGIFAPCSAGGLRQASSAGGC